VEVMGKMPLPPAGAVLETTASLSFATASEEGLIPNGN